MYIVGAAKCGTSALYSYLCLHPGISPPAAKESRFLHGVYGLQLSRFSPWAYRSCFPISSRLTFDADPSLCLMPELAAAFIKWMTPKAKIIFCWREPVSRAWSMYKFKSSIAGREEYGKTLKEIYQLEMKWINNGEMWAQMKSAAADLDGGFLPVKIPPSLTTAVIQTAMLRGGHYAEIYRAFQSFGDNLLLVKFSDFEKDPVKVMRGIFEFLALDSSIPLPDLKKVLPEEVLDYVVMNPKQSHQLSKEDRGMLEDYYKGMLQRDLSFGTFKQRLHFDVRLNHVR